MMKYAARLIALLLAIGISSFPVEARHPRPLEGTGGAVATEAPEATEAALQMLRAGGNAADAAVAAALALAVVAPNAGNLGGGGFAIVQIGGETLALDFRETAPSAARADMYQDSDGNAIPLKSLVGGLAAGVPGSPCGLFELHRRFGKLPWQRVVAPSIRLARDGFPLSKTLASRIGNSRLLLAGFPETAKIWLPGGRVPEAGRRMRVPALARSLQAYAERGPDALMKGEMAEAIERISRQTGGILSRRDLASYKAVWRPTISFRAWGWECYSMPLPSSGGIILAESCALLQRKHYRGFPRFGAQRAMLLTESWRRAYADRYLLGDTPKAGNAVDKILDPERLDRLAATIDLDRATPSASLGPLPVHIIEESDQTTHLSVIDGKGGAVGLTTTLNGNFGCGVLVPEGGFLLNNEMDDFAAAPGQANQFGLVQGKANAVGPGKRMLSSMAPTIACKDQEKIVLGAPGGSRIPTGTLQVLLHCIVDSTDLQEAVDLPRIHHQWLPDILFAEEGALSPESRKVLENMGLRIDPTGAVGLVQAVRRLSSGLMEAVADPRSGGKAGVLHPAKR